MSEVSRHERLISVNFGNPSNKKNIVIIIDYNCNNYHANYISTWQQESCNSIATSRYSSQFHRWKVGFYRKRSGQMARFTVFQSVKRPKVGFPYLGCIQTAGPTTQNQSISDCLTMFHCYQDVETQAVCNVYCILSLPAFKSTSWMNSSQNILHRSLSMKGLEGLNSFEFAPCHKLSFSTHLLLTPMSVAPPKKCPHHVFVGQKSIQKSLELVQSSTSCQLLVFKPNCS